MRLRSDGVLPAEVEKRFEVNPAVQTRPVSAKTTVTSISPAKQTLPIDATVPPADMQRCSLLELDNGQCRWPLGDVHQVATLFCGGLTEKGQRYCQLADGARRSSASEIGAILAAMLDLAQVRTLLLAERSHDVAVITEAVDAVLATSPEVSPTDIEMVFRDAGSPVYLIGKPELTIVIGMPAWRSALDRLGMSPQENRYALAGTTGHS